MSDRGGGWSKVLDVGCPWGLPEGQDYIDRAPRGGLTTAAMRSELRVSGWCLAVAVLVGHGCNAAPAIAAKAEDPVVRLDASARRFTESPRFLRHGTWVTLRVEQPNLFRESYALEIQDVDFHVLELPSPLSRWVGTSREAAVDLIGTGKFFQQPPDDARHADNLPVTLRGLFKEAANAADEMETQVTSGLVPKLALRPVLRLRTRLAACLDHREARRSAMLDAADLLEAWEVTTELAERFAPPEGEEEVSRQAAAGMREALATAYVTFSVVVVDWTTSWNRRYRAWQPAVAAWKSTRSPEELKGRTFETVVLADAHLQALNLWAQDVKAGADAAVLELDSYVRLVSAAVDPFQTPATIERTVQVEGDRVDVAVSIRPWVAAAADTLNLPKAPEVTLKLGVPVAGRWAISTSGGLSGSSLRGRNFVTVPGPDSGGVPRVLKHGARDDLDIGPAVLLHATRTERLSGVPFGWGPAVGVTVQDPVRYLLGGSLEIGSRSRLLVSAGIAWGKRDEPNGESVDRPMVNSPLEVRSVTRRGLFMSMTFALSLPKLGGGGPKP